MNKKIIWLLVLALVIAVAAYFYYKKKEDEKLKAAALLPTGNGGGSASPVNANTSIPAAVIAAENTPTGIFPVKYGSRGKVVQFIQLMVGMKPDGVWGAATDFAIRKAYNPTNGVITQSQFYNWALTGLGKSAASEWPLHQGSTGNYVKSVQVMLGLKVDGKFGANTAAAVQRVTGSPSMTAKQHLELIKSTFLI